MSKFKSGTIEKKFVNKCNLVYFKVLYNACEWEYISADVKFT